jgi:hypothetical protein
MNFTMQVDPKTLKFVARALREEQESGRLRRDLVREIKKAVDPGVQAVRGQLAIASVTSIASGASITDGRSRVREKPRAQGPTIGGYLASRVKPEVRLTGRTGGVRIRIPQTPSLRGFKLAARRLNRGTWRHPVFGTAQWVEQQSPIPGFFDTTLNEGKEDYKAAVVASLNKLAERIKARVEMYAAAEQLKGKSGGR